MKYFHTLIIGLMALTGVLLTACSEDEDVQQATATVEHKDFTIDPNADVIESATVEFDATGVWTLYSNEIWCQLERDGVKRNSLGGEAGHHAIKVVIDANQAQYAERQAVLRLKVGTNVYEVATVTLGRLLYRGMLTIDGTSYRSKDKVPVPVFESGNATSISANYDFTMLMPEWCLVDGKNFFAGKAGVKYDVKFSFDEDYTDPRYAIRDEIVLRSADDAIRDTFLIEYKGMNKYLTYISTELGKFDWTIDVDEQRYVHYNSGLMVDEELPTQYIPFTVAARNDDVVFVFAAQNEDKTYSFTTEASYANVVRVSEDYNSIRYSLTMQRTDYMPDKGVVMAFTTAAWDTIKSNPQTALFEAEEDGTWSWKYATSNNYVAEWKLYHENNCPFTLYDTRTYDMEQYVPELSNDYDKLFGCDGAWVVTSDLANACLQILLNEYEDDWYGQNVYIGFSPSAMKKSADDLDAFGLAAEHDHLYDRPALWLDLAPQYHAQAAAGPLYIAFRKDGKTQLLVIKPQ